MKKSIDAISVSSASGKQKAVSKPLPKTHDRNKSLHGLAQKPAKHCANERRKLPRFKPLRDLYVFHHEFGKVVELSMGGMVFTYLERASANLESPPKGILFDYQDQYIDDIPFETVSDQAAPSLRRNGHVIRQRHIQFGNLTEQQVQLLEQFILKNARIPQLAHDSRYTAHKTQYLAPSLYNFGFNLPLKQEGGSTTKL